MELKCNYEEIGKLVTELEASNRLITVDENYNQEWNRENEKIVTTKMLLMMLKQFYQLIQ